MSIHQVFKILFIQLFLLCF